MLMLLYNIIVSNDPHHPRVSITSEHHSEADNTYTQTIVYIYIYIYITIHVYMIMLCHIIVY